MPLKEFLDTTVISGKYSYLSLWEPLLLTESQIRLRKLEAAASRSGLHQATHTRIPAKCLPTLYIHCYKKNLAIRKPNTAFILGIGYLCDTMWP